MQLRLSVVLKKGENVGELRVTLIATGFDNNEELSGDDDHVNYQNPNNLSSGISKQILTKHLRQIL
ncbi:MAG: hypothetical protein Ct9H90mP18_02600 [Gammaproteobacteria bacterium]|nr:MAG: hypothetical protein Ct9H90mP18_02600 [Gammaproteobacteria bacterium]